MVVGAPLWVVIGTGVDLATKRPRLPSVRLAAYATFVLLTELVVAVLALTLWIVSLGGYRNLWSVYSSVQAWWVRCLFGVARPLLGGSPEHRPAPRLAAGQCCRTQPTYKSR